MERDGNKQLLYWIAAPVILTIATIITYLPSLYYDFQFDDIANITKNFNIRHNTFSDLFFTSTRWIIFWLNSLQYSISKFNPFTYRVGTVCVHTMNGLLLFAILKTMLSSLNKESFFKRNSFGLSFLTALMFLLHPVQTQTVSYVIQGELEGIAAFCAFSMLLSFLWINYTKNTPVRLFLYFLYFFLAVVITGTKEIAIVVPFLVILFDWFFVAQGNKKSFFSRTWFHGITSAIIFSLYIYFMKMKFFVELFGLKMQTGNNIGNVITADPNELITPTHFLISQFKVILHYLWIFIWPMNISVEYDWMLSRSFFAPDCIFPFIALCTIIYLVVKLLQRNPTNIVAFGLLWFGIVIAPRASIMPSPELMVDYKTYMGSAGWLLILAAALIKLLDWIKSYNKNAKFYLEARSGVYALVFLFALGMGYTTQQRNKVWESGLNFWANIVENAPGKARAYNNYGVELSQKLNKFSEAIPYFKHAISMDVGYRDPYNNLAVAYAATHQIDLAIETLQKSLKINRFYPEAYNNIASFLIEKKDFDKAREALRIALQLRSYYGKAHFNMGRICLEEGNQEEACEWFRKACTEADLDNEAGFFGYAKCCALMQKHDEAIWAFQRTLECNPHNQDAEFALANVYFMANKFDEADRAYRALIAKNPQDPKLWYNLAETHCSCGRTEQALECFEKIKQSRAITPNLFIRIAACYEQLGKPQMAKASLQELLSTRQLPDDAKQTVHLALNKLNQQYRLS